LSPWLKEIKKISLPIAHGEGHYVISKEEYEKMKKDGQIAFVYIKGDICKFQNLEKNPNGSDYCIAGVNAYNGRVLGMMPHPERAMFSHQNPMWQMLARSSGGNKKTKENGVGLQIFKNAVNYFKK
jgi:phosphoribosylformylglycinamidine synthase